MRRTQDRLKDRQYPRIQSRQPTLQTISGRKWSAATPPSFGRIQSVGPPSQAIRNEDIRILHNMVTVSTFRPV